jgi:amino acid adenylation domain-containing protein
VTDASLPLHQLFEVRASERPDTVAVVAAGGVTTYRELDERANAIAHRLRSLRVGAENPVGVALPRTPDLVAAVLAIHKAGGAYVPVGWDDPPERARIMLAEAGARVVLTHAVRADAASADGRRSVALDREDLPRHDDAPSGGRVDDDAAAYAMFTSGSTGRPKAVVITHAGIRNRVLWTIRRHRLGADDRVLQRTTITFDAAGWELFAPLVAGGATVLVDQARQHDPAAIVEAIRDHRVTVLQVVPSVLRLLLDEPGLSRCRSLRLVFSAGEPLPLALCERLTACLDVELVNTYGPTECSIDATAWRYRPGEWPDTVPIGRPIDNCSVLILTESGELAPVGTVGEINIGGVGVGRGYLGRAGLTAAQFVPNPFAAGQGERLYRTGDLGRWRNDGTIHFLGRRDHQLKVRGVRIEAGEVETALERCPSVAAAAVWTARGPGDDVSLVAYVVPRGGGAWAPEELRRWLEERLPAHSVPSHFVALDALPTTASGKVDRKALPAPVWGDEGAAAAYVAPRTPTEATIAEIWAEALGRDRVGIHDDFFELGGHSLLGARVLSRIQRTLGSEIPLRRLFDARTVARLAESLPAAQAPPAASSPRPRKAAGHAPLSFEQQRLWFLDRLSPRSVEYLAPVALELSGDLDLERIERALTDVARRHEVLRTRYELVREEPRQAIDDPQPVRAKVVDLRGEPIERRDGLVHDLVAEHARRPFDLAREHPLRVTVFRRGEREHVLLLTLHHIAFDGWSLEVLTHELEQLYPRAGEAAGRSLPPVRIQYADYATWQREWFDGDRLSAQLDYWKRQLCGIDALELPTDRPRVDLRDPAGGTVGFAAPQWVGRAIAELGRRLGATSFMTLLAAFGVLLHRYTGQRDFAVGTPIAGRPTGELDDLIGCFVNTQALRLDLHGDPTFTELVERVRTTALEANAHQDLPFERLVDELSPARDLSRNPLFDVMFDGQREWRETPRLPGLDVRPFPIDAGTSIFDLTLHAREAPDGRIMGELEFAAALFDRDTAAQIAEHYVTLLHSVAATPEARVRDLRILPARERDRLLIDFNPAVAPRAPEACMHDLVRERASEQPDAPAVASADRTLSYGELEEAVTDLARVVRAHGIGLEDRVVVFLERSPEAIVALLAVLRAGGVYVPINPSAPPGRTRLVLEDCAPRLVVTTTADMPALPSRACPVVCLDATPSPSGDAGVDPRVPAEAAAYMLYTSGSSSRPKAVVVEHRAYAQHCETIADAYGIHRDDRVGQLASLAFDVSLDQIGAPLIRGATVVVGDREFWAPSEAPDQVAAHRVSVLETTPSYYRAVMEHVAVGDARLAGLRLMNLGSEVATFGDVRAWSDRDLRARFINTYGPTEATITCTVHDASGDARRPESSSVALPIGLPVADARAHVVDADLNLVPVGVPGELCITGTRLARGYRARPGATAAAFVPDPYATKAGGRMYRTGDLVRRRADGAIQFIGRLDGQVKVRGQRVELDEIEAVLAEHPGVRAAAVAVRELRPGDPQLVGYVVPLEGPVDVAQLREHARHWLPSYAVPAAWEPLDRLPLTANQKVDRGRLPTPRLDSRAAADGGDAPMSAVETAIAATWSDLLGIESVGRDDDFFALGGHSLLAARVLVRLQDRFGVDIPLRRLFDATSVAELARVVEAAVEAQVAALSDAEVEAMLAEAPPPEVVTTKTDGRKHFQ